MFSPVDPKQSFPALEEEILKRWREDDTFKRSLQHRAESDAFHFYDGPPFATGLPHYGHILAGTIKDVIPRYQTMRGKHVKRRFGWDCHGLPVEHQIEKQHGLKTKRDIESLGVKEFNDLCRNAVLRYTREWTTTVERLGRWVDMDYDYRTMDPDYMESIWWVFKQLYDKGLIYEGYKAMHLCPRCETTLSNFEVTQGYKEVSDCTVTAKFALVEDPHTFLLAWTTTPWTLPGNLFLAVNPEETYVSCTRQNDDAIYILSQRSFAASGGRRIDEIHENDADPPLKQIATLSGKDLIGKRYTPVFPYFASKYEHAFRVVGGDFVTSEEGTGIVHIAPGFGEDDFSVGKREGVAMLQHVLPDGTFTADVTDFAGMSVKPKDAPSSTDKKIAEHLKNAGLLFEQKSYTHSYPHCWRCDTPLINYATTSWFVAVEKIKQEMLAANARTTWVPSAIRDGRFGKWLEGARDWAISRSRYWGTPLPIWRNRQTGQLEVLGSRDDLMNRVPGRFTKITIARHAESVGNVQQIYQGKSPGTNLTPTGKKQAAALGKALERNCGIPVTAIYHSPLARTTQTAAAVARVFSVPLTQDERLREVSFGEYEGKHIDFDDLTFVRQRRAHKLSKGQVESIYHFEGMETWHDIELRTKEFLEDILPRHRGEHIVIVTHADIVMNFTHLFTGIDKAKIAHQPYPELAQYRTFYWDHSTQTQLDLHKETVDEITWHGTGTPKDARVELTVARHGETDWNKAGIFQGHSDQPLNADGILQAEELAATLDPSDYDVILSSDLLRARQTADIIGAKWEREVIISPLFREQNLGEWEGKTKADVLSLFPHYVQDFFSRIHNVPGGEDLASLAKRVAAGRDELLRTYAGKRVLLISHGRWINALARIETNEPIFSPVANAGVMEFTLEPRLSRVADVMDCWFESGSMPYAQEHFPFDAAKQETKKGKKSKNVLTPASFPADFIAEGLDQTRGWFYTLTVLGVALFGEAPFKNVIVNGIVLAEDGRKMSKSLKNYPEPTQVVERHGADSVRFALMASPAVRAEDLRFSETVVEDALRNVLLPLWNAYNLFVTYANAAAWEPPSNWTLKKSMSKDPLDLWIVAHTQSLVNALTTELDRYDLSASCAHLSESIDGLTNWYIRLQRRRFAGKEEGREEALDTLYRVLLTLSQLLAPFCPFITESIYTNLVKEPFGSIHLTDWPASIALTKKDREVLALMNNTRAVVTLGLSLRSDAKVKVRCPLQSVTVALSPSDTSGVREDIIRDELNVKEVKIVSDPGSLARAFVAVDARKVGPRLGAKVQDIIRAGKEGRFTQKGDTISIEGETLQADEAKIMYAGAEGQNIAADHGIIVRLDITVTEELKREGDAREIVRMVQKLRKSHGLSFTDTISLSITGADDVLASHKTLIEKETRGRISKNPEAGTSSNIPPVTETFSLDDREITISFLPL